MSTFLTCISIVIALIGTMAAIYFAHENHRLAQQTLASRESASATIDIRITNPPPYLATKPCTEFVVRNVGQRTSGNLDVAVRCSWLELFDLTLHFPSDEWVLQPNEEYRWRIRLPEAPTTPGTTISVTVKDLRFHMVWTQKESVIAAPVA